MNIDDDFELTQNAIKYLLTTDEEELKSLQLDLTFQILSIRKNESVKPNQNSVYTAVLSDSKFKYGGFVIKDFGVDLDEKDIIKITSVSSAVLNQRKSKVFIIKNCELLKKHQPLIGNPQSFRDEASAPAVEPVTYPYLATNTNTPKFDVQMANTNETYTKEKQAVDSSKFFTPLAQLTSFSKNLQLLVRVVKKNALKTYNNTDKRNSCRVFTFIVMDSEGSEMQASAFNKTCDKYFSMIKENCVYEILGGYVKISDRKYTMVKSDYTLVIDEKTKIIEREDDGKIKEIAFNFVKISSLAEYSVYSIVDILAYVIESNEKQTKMTKNGEQSTKRLVLGDDSGYKTELTLWKQFSDCDIRYGQIVAFKRLKIIDFSGVSLSSIDDSVITVDPPIKEAIELNTFLANNNVIYKSLASISNSQSEITVTNTNIAYLKETLDSLNTIPEDKVPVSRVKVTVCSMAHSDRNYYAGCPDSHCKKKLMKETYNWTCSSCNKEYMKPTYYYKFCIKVKDCTGEQWIDIFGNVGDKLFNVTSEEYKDFVENKDEARLDQITEYLEFREFYFLMKPKIHVYNSVSKRKLNVYRIDTVDSLQEIKRILKNLTNILYIKK